MGPSSLLLADPSAQTFSSALMVLAKMTQMTGRPLPGLQITHEAPRNEANLLVVGPVIALPDDLNLLPAPFFDRRDVRALNLPFVFLGNAEQPILEGAGAVSSWFGSLAGYRGAKFPTATAVPAKGPAVVFMVGNTGLPGVDLPVPTGPAVAMVTNPNDPVSKLLVVMGRNAADIKVAANVLAVGGTTLATLLSQLRYRASVASVGLAGGTELTTTVLPFLLRGVNLLGIDSVMCPVERRQRAWDRLAAELPADMLESMTEVIPLDALPEYGGRILAGQTRGRVVVEMG